MAGAFTLPRIAHRSDTSLQKDNSLRRGTETMGFFSTLGAMTLSLASSLGIPVSTTHTITGAIVGVGAGTGVRMFANAPISAGAARILHAMLMEKHMQADETQSGWKRFLDRIRNLWAPTPAQPTPKPPFVHVITRDASLAAGPEVSAR